MRAIVKAGGCDDSKKSSSPLGEFTATSIWSGTPDFAVFHDVLFSVLKQIVQEQEQGQERARELGRERGGAAAPAPAAAAVAYDDADESSQSLFMSSLASETVSQLSVSMAESGSPSWHSPKVARQQPSSARSYRRTSHTLGSSATSSSTRIHSRLVRLCDSFIYV